MSAKTTTDKKKKHQSLGAGTIGRSGKGKKGFFGRDGGKDNKASSDDGHEVANAPQQLPISQAAQQPYDPCVPASAFATAPTPACNYGANAVPFRHPLATTTTSAPHLVNQQQQQQQQQLPPSHFPRANRAGAAREGVFGNFSYAETNANYGYDAEGRLSAVSASSKTEPILEEGSSHRPLSSNTRLPQGPPDRRNYQLERKTTKAMLEAYICEDYQEPRRAPPFGSVTEDQVGSDLSNLLFLKDGIAPGGRRVQNDARNFVPNQNPSEIGRGASIALQQQQHLGISPLKVVSTRNQRADSSASRNAQLGFKRAPSAGRCLSDDIAKIREESARDVEILRSDIKVVDDKVNAVLDAMGCPRQGEWGPFASGKIAKSSSSSGGTGKKAQSPGREKDRISSDSNTAASSISQNSPTKKSPRSKTSSRDSQTLLHPSSGSQQKEDGEGSPSVSLLYQTCLQVSANEALLTKSVSGYAKDLEAIRSEVGETNFKTDALVRLVSEQARTIDSLTETLARVLQKVERLVSNNANSRAEEKVHHHHHNREFENRVEKALIMLSSDMASVSAHVKRLEDKSSAPSSPGGPFSRHNHPDSFNRSEKSGESSLKDNASETPPLLFKTETIEVVLGKKILMVKNPLGTILGGLHMLAGSIDQVKKMLSVMTKVTTGEELNKLLENAEEEEEEEEEDEEEEMEDTQNQTESDEESEEAYDNGSSRNHATRTG